MKMKTLCRVYQATIHILFLTAVLALSLLCLPEMAAAKATISDEAEILEEDKIKALTDSCESIYNIYDTEVVILTRNGIPSSRKTYLEDYADSTEVTDAVLLLINMDPNDRGYEIQGYGSAEFSLNDKRIENTLDDMYPDMRNGDYTQAVQIFLDDVAKACASFDYEDYEEHPEDYVPHGSTDYRVGIFSPITQLAISAGIALIVVLIMVSNSGGKMTVNQNTYLDKSDSRLLARYDHYIRTSTSKRRKPSESSGGGGHSGGGVSSGGRSHSGGGRSF